MSAARFCFSERKLRAGLAVALTIGCAGDRPGFTEHTGHLGGVRHEIVGGRPVERGEFSGVVWLDSGCTATLVHPMLVVYAAHCGIPTQGAWVGDKVELEIDAEAELVHVVPNEGQRILHVATCMSNPAASIGNGRDIAFCLLREPAVGVEPLSISERCERQNLSTGHPVTLVGFGFDSELEDPKTAGQKRVTSASITDVGVELQIGEADAGTCAGDSGGPALLRTRAGIHQVLGILSSGEPGRCGAGRYVDIRRWLHWLEEATGISPLAAPHEEACPQERDARSHDANDEPAVGSRVSGGSSCALRAGLLGTRARSLRQFDSIAVPLLLLAWRNAACMSARRRSAELRRRTNEIERALRRVHWKRG